MNNKLLFPKAGVPILGLFIASTYISQTVMDLFSILLFSWTLLNLKAGLFWKKNEFELIFASWFTYILIGLFLSPIQPSADYILSRAFEFYWVIILFYLPQVFEFVKLKFDSLKKYFLLALIPLVYSFLTVLFKKEFITGEVLKRAGGFFFNPMTFGHVILFPFCIVLGIILVHLNFNRIKNLSFLYLFSFTLLIASIVFTLTRGVWIGISFAAIIGSFMLGKKTGIRVVLTMLFATVLIIAVSPSIRNRITYSTLIFHVKDSRQYDDETSYDIKRVWLWQANIEIFKDHPLFGVGYGLNTSLLPSKYQKLGINHPRAMYSHAHNQYLHFLAGTGLVGLSFYLLIIGFFLKTSIQNFKRVSHSHLTLKGLSLGTSMAIIAFLIAGFTEANFEHAKVKYQLAIVFSLTLWIRNSVRRSALNIS